jgi:Ala-tRNA(Pro) deacylase
MALTKLKQYLDSKGVKYTILQHSPAYTAQEIAAKAHVPGQQLAKSVMVKLDGELAMAVVPASTRVDLNALARAVGAKEATLAHESEFARVFEGCEPGAMPPFGNLWRIPVFVSDTLAEDEIISFNAGNHTELMTLSFEDYHRLVEPKILSFSRAAA